MAVLLGLDSGEVNHGLTPTAQSTFADLNMPVSQDLWYLRFRLPT